MCKVLIVDDEILVRQGIKYLLDWEREGFQIVGEASNGQEALDFLKIEKPHIVITDIVMPVMNGEELTRLVKRDHPEMEVIVLSSFSEFDYVRSTFQNGVADYILKPKLEAEALLQVLRKTRGRIPGLESMEAPQDHNLSVDSILSRLVAGYEIQVDADFVRLQFPHELFSFLGCEVNRSVLKDRHYVNQFRESIETMLKENVPGLVQHTISGEQEGIVFLLNLEEKRWLETVQAVKSFSQSVVESQPELRFTLSQAFRQFSEAAGVYQESHVKLQQYRFFFPYEVLLIHSELPAQEAEPEKFNLTQFTEQLKRLQLEEAFTELRQYVTSLSHHYESDIFQFKSFLGNIIFNVTNQFSHIKDLEEQKYALFRAIDEAKFADEAIGILGVFLDQVQDQTSSLTQSPGSIVNMKKLLDYIDEHYTEPLSLTELARHFHFNPSYLSSLFTAHNKEGFKEHLNTIRTDKAAELLRAGEAPISEISSMVGYGDHSYFCKVFKKYTGLSPSGYRRQYYSQE
nr:response regulator transcription factor [Paenibacillus monticola]